MADYPFLRPAFLDLLEDSGSVGPDTGWTPRHLRIATNGAEQAFMPLYLKDHSWGEYVFDWAWADAWRRHGLPYYPKLLSAIPFTPGTSAPAAGTSCFRLKTSWPCWRVSRMPPCCAAPVRSFTG